MFYDNIVCMRIQLVSSLFSKLVVLCFCLCQHSAKRMFEGKWNTRDSFVDATNSWTLWAMSWLSKISLVDGQHLFTSCLSYIDVTAVSNAVYGTIRFQFCDGPKLLSQSISRLSKWYVWDQLFTNWSCSSALNQLTGCCFLLKLNLKSVIAVGLNHFTARDKIWQPRKRLNPELSNEI